MARASKSDIARAILQLSKVHSGQKLAREIAAYITSERRTNELEAIIREVRRLREQQDGIVEVDITTAFPATDKIKRQITDIVGTKNVVINEVIDKSVIGGVRMETSDTYLDLTVRNRLERLKNMKQGVVN